MNDVYIINLKKRLDRWEKICNNIKNKSSVLNPIRFNALEGTPGWIYCALSHISLVEKAKKENMPYIIVFEDDNEIIDNKFDLKFLRIIDFLERNSNKWDIFNGNPSYISHKKMQKMQVISPYPILVQYQYGKTTNFMIYNKSCYDKIISLRSIYDGSKKDYAMFAYDKKMCEIGLKCVTSYPYLSRQMNSYSDIDKKVVNYDSGLINHGMNIIGNRIKNNFVSCKLIGGLGNQMFTMVAAFATAMKNNCILLFQKKNHVPCKYRDVNEYFNTFFNFIDFPFKFVKCNKEIKEKNGFEFQQIIKNYPKLMLSGYFQNTKYFNQYKNEIKNFFRMDNNTKNHIETTYDFVNNKEKIKVMIHVRRGDYVLFKHYHHNVPLVYYNNCIKQIKKKYENKELYFVVFSDDINWCKSNIEADYYVEGEKDYIEMYIMTYFDVYVLSNSTFCWWGAYLSLNNKIEGYIPFKWLENGKYPEGLVLDGLVKIVY